MKLKARWFSVWCLLLLACVLSGCGTKVSKLSRDEIQARAIAAKERAVAFAPIAPQLKAKDASHQNDIQRWAGTHAERLATRAKAWADLDAAVQLGGLSATTIHQLGSMAETAKAGAENFRAQTKYIDWRWPEFVQAHQEALDAEAARLVELYNALRPKDKAAPADPPKPADPQS